MAVIEGASQGFDFRAFQQQQANVPDPLPAATTSADAVTPPSAIETVDRFVQNAAIDRQRAVQSASRCFIALAEAAVPLLPRNDLMEIN